MIYMLGFLKGGQKPTMKSEKLLTNILSEKIERDLKSYQVVGRSGCRSGGKGKCAWASAWLLARRVGFAGRVAANGTERKDDLLLRAVLKLVSQSRMQKLKTKNRHIIFTFNSNEIIKG
jgi:hypothetical protein